MNLLASMSTLGPAYLNIVWLAGTACLLIGLALTLYLAARPGGFGGPLLGRYLRHIDHWLDLLASKTKPIEVVQYELMALGSLIAMWLLMDWTWVLFGIPLIMPITYGALRIKYSKRCEALELQLDGWLLMLSNMLSATGSVGDAIQSSAELIDEPLKVEIELVLKTIEVGTTIEDSLDNMLLRVPSNALKGIVTSLRVGRQFGGDLPSLLAENAAALRESQRIDQFISSQVSGGRLQLIVLAIAPLALIYMFESVTPGFFDPLLNYILGPHIISLCCVIWLASIVIGWKIMDVDV